MERPRGILRVDQNGFAKYVYPITVLPGIGSGNQPEISLNYAQNSNISGACGLRWTLNGLSSIFVVPPSRAIDNQESIKAQNIKINYRYALGGSELVCTSGVYGSASASYATEHTPDEVISVSAGGGFVLKDAQGHAREYGTTDDSKLSDQRGSIVEWRLKKSTDAFGNYVLYNYTQDPLLVASGRTPTVRKNAGVSYISNILYTSNDQQSMSGRMFVRFLYNGRSDAVLASVHGSISTRAHRLERIETGITGINGGDVTARSYDIAYEYATNDGASRLTSIVERGSNGTALRPTTFRYSSNDNVSVFQHAPDDVYTVNSSMSTVTVLPLNTTGSGYSDLTFVKRDASSGHARLQSFLADAVTPMESSTVPRIGWGLKANTIKDAHLPWLDPVLQPTILAADLNFDGRTDLVIPHRDSTGRLMFSISRASGSGYDDAYLVSSGSSWLEKCRFMAMDTNGSGYIDIVQIMHHAVANEYRIRVYYDIYELRAGQVPITSESASWHEPGSTLDWVVVRQQSTGTTALVHVTDTDKGNGMHAVQATTFSSSLGLGARTALIKGTTTSLDDYYAGDGFRRSLLACDINGDGATDILLCAARLSSASKGLVTIMNSVFLNDGSGNFLSQGSTTTDVQAGVPESEGHFYALNLENSSCATIAYIYPESLSNSWVCIAGNGSSLGRVSDMTRSTIFSRPGLPASSFRLMPADLGGTGRTGWLAYRVAGTSCTVLPVYNARKACNMLVEVADPLGLKQSITYASTANAVYDRGVSLATYRAPDDDSSVACLSLPSNLVASVFATNDTSINILPYTSSYDYSYRAGLSSRSGRGWCGFSSVTRLDKISGIRVVSSYAQQGPLAGLPVSVETYGSSADALQERLARFPPVYQGDQLELLERQTWQYESVLRSNPNNAPIYTLRQTAERIQTFDGFGILARTKGVDITHEGDTNYHKSEHTFSRDDTQNTTLSELWKRYEYETNAGHVNPAPLACKLSSNVNNVDFSRLEAGDYSLVRSEFDNNGALIAARSFNVDASDSTATRVVDGFGNELSVTNAAGLVTVTTYDKAFPQFPISTTVSGHGVDQTTYKAYDIRYGTVVVENYDSGDLNASMLDEWGREVKKAVLSTSPADDDFRYEVSSSIVAGATFRSQLESVSMCPIEETVYDKQPGLNSKITSTIFDATDTRFRSAEAFDCLGRKRKQLILSKEEHVLSGKCYEYDSNGNTVLESVNAANQTSWTSQPDPSASTVKVFDALKREILVIRPASTSLGGFTAVAARYSQGGGARIAEMKHAPSMSDLSSGGGKVISKTQQSYMTIGQRQCIISSTTDSGLKSTFAYDGIGRLLTMTDPAGKAEHRSYNTNGSVTRIDNLYQNPLGRPDALTRCFDSANQVLSETNALGETTRYTYDAKGRMLQKIRVGTSGKTIRKQSLTYATTGADNGRLISVQIYEGESSSPQCSYTYTYDVRGQQVGRTVHVGGRVNASYDFTYNIDRLGRLVSKQLPDGSTLHYDYEGGLRRQTGMRPPPGEDWGLDLNQNYDPSGVPVAWTLSGTGSTSTSTTGSMQFDVNGLPIRLDLRDSKQVKLADFEIAYDPFDQVATFSDHAENATTSYEYQDHRLMHSKGPTSDRAYSYTPSGDILRKDGMDLKFSRKSDLTELEGTKDGATVIVSRTDAAGRVVERQVNGGPLQSFSYDENDKMCAISDTSGTTQLLTDHQGKTLARCYPDGRDEIMIDDDYHEYRSADGSRRIQRFLRNAVGVVASISSTKKAGSTRAGPADMNVFMSDHKGNITHVFDQHGTLRRRLRYDDFGASLSSPGATPRDDNGKTFEAMSLETATGLLDFNARMYDPVLGRFTTPDTWLSLSQMLMPDGLNRMAFENNDPINHTDPTGHLSSSFWGGLFAGLALLIIGIIISVATAGLAVPFLAAIAIGAAAGAFIGAGIAGITYSIKHRNEEDKNTFWAGWGIEVGIGAAIGAVTGAFAAGVSWVSSLQTAADAMGTTVEALEANIGRTGFQSMRTFQAARWAVSAFTNGSVNAFGSVVKNIGDNYVENRFYDQHLDLTWKDVVKDIGMTFAFSALGSGKGYFTDTNAGYKGVVAGLKAGFGSLSLPQKMMFGGSAALYTVAGGGAGYGIGVGGEKAWARGEHAFGDMLRERYGVELTAVDLPF